MQVELFDSDFRRPKETHSAVCVSIYRGRKIKVVIGNEILNW